jgi:hypothetical protein
LGIACQVPADGKKVLRVLPLLREGTDEDDEAAVVVVVARGG